MCQVQPFLIILLQTLQFQAQVGWSLSGLQVSLWGCGPAYNLWHEHCGPIPWAPGTQSQHSTDEVRGVMLQSSMNARVITCQCAATDFSPPQVDILQGPDQGSEADVGSFGWHRMPLKSLNRTCIVTLCRPPRWAFRLRITPWTCCTSEVLQPDDPQTPAVRLYHVTSSVHRLKSMGTCHCVHLRSKVRGTDQAYWRITWCDVQ
mmetsp:Transcript_106305/g.183302  ORF Transcript_106305/g.183302 Transcript_106305/m.183302 type:complete len:204 (+) Transcript_106305:523-1134(+)